MKNEIIPAILTNTRRILDKKIKLVEGTAKTVQIDIMDGKFVKNKTITGKDLLKSKLNYDIHLMVKNPWEKIIEYPRVYRITFHIEACKNKYEIEKTIKLIKKNKSKVGIAINPSTKIEKIKPYLDKIDLVLIMTVKPGKGGQKFLIKMMEKIKKVRNWSKIDVQVDGGVNTKTMIDCIVAGANKLVMGSAIFNAKNPKKEFERLQRLI